MAENTMITMLQLSAAHKLALEYGHEWGGLEVNQVTHWRRWERGVSLDAIARATRTKYPHPDAGWMEGIIAPSMDEVSNLVHMTGSGRLTWKIAPDGVTTLVVGRPEGDAISVVTSFRCNVDAVTLLGAPFGMRHLGAMAKALSVLVGGEGAFHTLAPLVGQAIAFDAEEQAREVAALLAQSEPVEAEKVSDHYGTRYVELADGRFVRYNDRLAPNLASEDGIDIRHRLGLGEFPGPRRRRRNFYSMED